MAFRAQTKDSTAITDQADTEAFHSLDVARKKGAPARARREMPAVKRDAHKTRDMLPAKRRALDSIIKDEEVKVTTQKARLKTEDQLPEHLKVPPTERTTLVLSNDDISTLVEFMPKVREEFRFAFNKEGHLRVKFHSLLEQTVTRKGVSTDRFSQAIKWSNVRDYGVRKATSSTSGAFTVDDQIRLRRPKRVKDQKSGGVTKRNEIDLDAMDARERHLLLLDIIDANRVA